MTAGDRSTSLAAVTGVAGAAWIAFSALAAGLAQPGYSHRSQFLSELGARGARHEDLMSLAGFLPAGLLLLAFAIFAARAAPGGAGTKLGFAGLWFYALGYVAAAFYRCDPGCDMIDPSTSQVVHTAIGGLGYVAGAASIILLGVASRRWPGAGVLSPLGIAGGIVALGALPLMAPEWAYKGLAQRVVEAAVLSWIVACALYLRPSRSAARSTARPGGTSMNHFVTDTAAERYRRGRPDFHAVVMERIESAAGSAFRPRIAVDIGCGTGLSTIALTRIAQKVIGIDSSLEMLFRGAAHERARYAVGAAESIPVRSGIVELITVASALHWFSAGVFLMEARRIGTRDAWLVVYDHFIREMEDEPRFRSWFLEDYMTEFPMPPRDRRPIEEVIDDSTEWRLYHAETFSSTVTFSRSSLIDYLSSQTNVIWSVEGQGTPLERVRSILNGELEAFFASRDEAPFRFEGPINFLRPARTGFP